MNREIGSDLTDRRKINQNARALFISFIQLPGENNRILKYA